MKKKYYPYLDIFRTLLTVSVLLYHLDILKGGYLAVCGFFVLSGYLCASSFIENENISLWQYYSRRIKRLYLPLLLVVFCTLTVVYFCPDIIWVSLKPEAESVLLGYNNFFQIKANGDYFARHSQSPFMHMWYISIVLQFEIIFPVLFVLVRKVLGNKLKREKVFYIIISFLSVFLYILYDLKYSTLEAYYHSFSRAFSLLTAVAFCYIGKSFSEKNTKSKFFFFFEIAVLFLMFILSSYESKYRIGIMIAATFISVMAVTECCRIETGDSIIIQICRHISELSYFIYLIQYPVIYFFQQYLSDEGWYRAVIVLLTIGLSEIFRLIFSKKTRGMLKVILVVIALLSSLAGVYKFIITEDNTAEMKALEEQLAENEMWLETQQNLYQINSANQALELKHSLLQLENDELQLEEAIKKIKITAVGDSVMLGAYRNILSVFENGYVDAKKSRSTWAIASTIDKLSKSNSLGEIIIVHTGTNGDGPAYLKEQIMANCQDKEVFWITVTNDNDVHYNSRLKKFVEQYDNAHLIDWEAFSKGHSEYFYSDGIHLPEEGRKAYTQLIYDSIYQFYLEEIEAEKQRQIDEYKQSRMNIISFYGNDLLINISYDLVKKYPESSFENSDYSFDSLYHKIENDIANDRINNRVVLVFDNSLVIDNSQYEKIRELLKDYQFYSIFIDSTIDSKTNTYFTEELKNNADYLLFDRVHLSDKGNQMLLEMIYNMLEQ